jgi:large repetitive protein
VFTTAASVVFVVGQSNTLTVMTSGFNVAQPMLISHGTLPSFITSFTDNGDGTATIIGTPTATGTATLSLTASNGVGPGVTKTFTIALDSSPTIKSTSGSQTFTVSQASSFAVAVNAGVPSATTFTVTGLPKGLTFKSSGTTVTIHGTPVAGTGGSYPIAVTANSTSSTATELTLNYTLDVNQAPVFTSAASTAFIVGQSNTFTVKTSGFNVAQAMTISHGTLPSFITSFTDNGNGTATIVGTPTASGTATITLTASNAIGTPAPQTLTINMDTAPTPGNTSGSQTFVVGKAGSFSVSVNAGVPTATMFTVTGLPRGLTFNGRGTTVIISGTPGAGTAGTYPIVAVASSSAATTLTENFTLTVNQASAFTSAGSGTYAVGQGVNFAVKTSGFPIAALKETGTLPLGLSFVDNGDGTAVLTGIPQPGTGGTYQLVFKATVGATVVNQNFTLTINQAPVFTSANNFAFTLNDPSSTFTFTTAGFPAATLSKIGTLPTGLRFTNKGKGTATLTGKPTQTGTFTFIVKALVAGQPPAFQLFTVTVS